MTVCRVFDKSLRASGVRAAMVECILLDTIILSYRLIWATISHLIPFILMICNHEQTKNKTNQNENKPNKKNTKKRRERAESVAQNGLIFVHPT